jgi:hypothetical protein
MAVISIPNKSTYTNALEHAELLREVDNDQHHIAHTLLYLAERNQKLEAVVKAAQLYIQFGQDPQLHTELVKELEHFDDYQVEAETIEDSKFGLN